MARTKSFSYWQWRTIVVSMLGYAMFYLVRKNFALAMPGLGTQFGISKVQLGIFLTLHGIIYGLSRFVIGIVTDRGSARKVMSIGLLLCGIVNIFFGVSDHASSWLCAIAGKAGDTAAFTLVLVYVMGILWLINGFLQGCGVPPCTKLMTNWIHPGELATKMSVWNMSHSIGAGLALGLCGWWIMPRLGWRWCFIIPAGVAVAGAFFLWFSLKDSPTDVGYPEVVDRPSKAKPSGRDPEYRAFVRSHVYGNRIIWTLALTNFFLYIVRFAALDWGPTLLTESKGLSIATATTICVAFELLGGNLGMLFWGWATDHWFHSKAHRTSVVCMAGAALSVAGLFMLGGNAPWQLVIIPYTLLGFCLYGPQALLGICAAQHATNRASATANGILGIFGYASTLISGVGFGFAVEHYGWNAAYLVIFGASLLAIASLLSIWRAGANGYDADEV